MLRNRLKSGSRLPDGNSAATYGSPVVSTAINLSTTSLSGRTGGDCACYKVSSLTNQSVVVTQAPGANLQIGDEVMLLSVYTTNADFSNVGNFEFLRVASVSQVLQ